MKSRTEDQASVMYCFLMENQEDRDYKEIILVNDAAVLENFHGEKHGLQPENTDYSAKLKQKTTINTEKT